MGGRAFDERESISQVRERLAGLDQRLTSVETSTQREVQLLRSYFDEKFDSQRNALIEQKKDLKDYIDHKFVELSRTLIEAPRTAKPDPTIPMKFWVAIVVIGLVSSLTFIAFVSWLIVVQPVK